MRASGLGSGSDEKRARDAMAALLGTGRMDCWLRLRFRHDVSESTALDHIRRFVSALRHASRGIRIVVGLHRDPMLHGHAAVGLSRRLRARFLNAEELGYWFQERWPHGEVWCEAWDEERGGSGRAITYLARHPETVTLCEG